MKKILILSIAILGILFNGNLIGKTYAPIDNDDLIKYKLLLEQKKDLSLADQRLYKEVQERLLCLIQDAIIASNVSNVKKLTTERGLSQQEAPSVCKWGEQIFVVRRDNLAGYKDYTRPSNWWIPVVPVYIYWKILQSEKEIRDGLYLDADEIKEWLNNYVANNKLKYAANNELANEITQNYSKEHNPLANNPTGAPQKNNSSAASLQKENKPKSTSFPLPNAGLKQEKESVPNNLQLQ